MYVSLCFSVPFLSIRHLGTTIPCDSNAVGERTKKIRPPQFETFPLTEMKNVLKMLKIQIEESRFFRKILKHLNFIKLFSAQKNSCIWGPEKMVTFGGLIFLQKHERQFPKPWVLSPHLGTHQSIPNLIFGFGVQDLEPSKTL